MAIYISLEGIPGEVKEHKHEKWIELHSCQLGAHKEGADKTGSLRVCGTTILHDISVTKNCDSSTPKLFEHVALGKIIPKIVIDKCVSTKDGQNVIEKITLTDTMVTNYNTSCSDEGRPTDSFSLNFTTIKMETFGVKKDGSPSASGDFGWNIPAAKPL